MYPYVTTFACPNCHGPLVKVPRLSTSFAIRARPRTWRLASSAHRPTSDSDPHFFSSAEMNDDTLVFSASDAPAGDSLHAIDAGLEEYNLSVAPLSDVRPLASFATDPAGQVVGGASGRTWGRCCELLQLWVEPRRRSAGVGSRLLQLFEEHAQRRGCDVFYLTTLSFQAPAFYRKHGYVALAEISGYPDGITKYLMHKTGNCVVSSPSHLPLC